LSKGEPLRTVFSKKTEFYNNKKLITKIYFVIYLVSLV
jgi:hypothetical protein